MKRVLCWLILLSLLGNICGCTITSEGDFGKAGVSSEGYKITYQKEGFQVRERLLGRVENWEWNSFTMPNLRVHNPLPDLGLDSLYPDEKYKKCQAQIKETGWCRETVEFTTSEGKVNSFSLVKNQMPLAGGDYKLEKDGKILWESRLEPGLNGSIISSKRIGDELAIEYFHVPDPKSGNFTHSILITSQNTVADLKNTTGYDAVFAPNEVNKQLIYFAQEYVPEVTSILIYDGKAVAKYDSV